TYNDSDGNPVRQAGAHPDVNVSFTVPPGTAFSSPTEQPHRLFVDMPAGLIGNATAAPRCSEANIKDGPSSAQPQCPVGSQVGVVTIGFQTVPLYNVDPPKGTPAMFALNFLGAVVYLTPTVRAGDAGITIDSGSMVQASPFSLIQTTIWGVPADPANDAWRWGPVGSQGLYQRPAASQSPRRAFMSLPTSCSGEPLETTGRLDGWFSKGQFAIESFTSDPNDVPFVISGCESLPFNPSVNIETTTRQTDAPSGLSFTLNVPQSDSPDGLATAHVRNVSVTLPEGVSISPAAASGL